MTTDATSSSSSHYSLPEFIMFLTSLVVGLTMVMGVNAINSAPSFMLDYYKYIDKSPDAIPKYTNFWTNVLTYYTVVTLVAQALHEPTNLTSFMRRFSLVFRMLTSVLAMLIELLVIVILPHSGASEEGAIVAMVLVAYLGGMARAYYENTGYALFGPCPSKMLSGMLVGSAASGALVSIIQIILKVSMDDNYEGVLTQSIIYFTMSLAIIFLGGLGVLLLVCNPFAKHYIAEFRSRRTIFENIYHKSERARITNPHHDDNNNNNNKNEEEVEEMKETKNGQMCIDTEDAAIQGKLCREGVVEAEEPNYNCCYPSRGDAGATKKHKNENEKEKQDYIFDDRERIREQTTAATVRHNCYNQMKQEAQEPILTEEEDEDDNENENDNAIHKNGGNKNNHDNNATIITQPIPPTEKEERENEKNEEPQSTSELLQQVSVFRVCVRIWPMMLSCLLLFGITYLMYPGVLLAVDADDAWYTTIVMTVYNFGDLIGRGLSMIKKLWVPRKVVFIVAIARVIFIPLLMLCADKKIPSHAAAYVFTAALGITNGFFGTLSMVYAPDTKSLRSEGERAMAGQATGVMLLAGCAVGSLVQIALVLPFN